MRPSFFIKSFMPTLSDRRQKIFESSREAKNFFAANYFNALNNLQQ